MEFGWACLLFLALLDRQARPLALLFAANWLLNYTAYAVEEYRLPVLFDFLAAAVAVEFRWLERLTTGRLRIIAASLVLAMLAHAGHWLLWDAGNANDAVRFAYYTLLALLFSVKVLSLSWPGVCSLVGIVSDGLGRTSGWLLDRLAPVPRSRPRPSRW